MYFSPRKKYCQNQTKLWVISQNSSFRVGSMCLPRLWACWVGALRAHTQQAQTCRPDLCDALGIITQAGSSDRGFAPT